MKEIKRTIWQNVNLNPDDYKEFFDQEYPDLDDDERYELMVQMNNDSYDEEMSLLNKKLNENIVIIADLGLWDGRHHGIKELGNNLRECFYTECDYVDWYCDEKDLRCDAYHHDGTNHYLYRKWKPYLTQRKKDNFIKKVLDHKANEKDIAKYTETLVKEIAELYGWDAA